MWGIYVSGHQNERNRVYIESQFDGGGGSDDAR